MTPAGIERDNVRKRTLWCAPMIALAGAAASWAVARLVSSPLPQGISHLAFFTLVLAVGLAITGVIVWRRTGVLAGDSRRPGLVAVLSFFVVREGEWLNLLQLEGGYQIAARFGLDMGAFLLAMLVFMWLHQIDAREAARNAPVDTDGGGT